MFTVIYTFEVKPGKEKQFLEAWAELTKYIYEFSGSLGSRLHFQKQGNYVAYAQWPDKETWKSMGSKLPAESKIHGERMRDSLLSNETLFELQVTQDLLKSKLFS